MSIPGFEAEPIQWTREYWVTRRILRAIWILVLTLALLGLIIAGVMIGQGKMKVHDFQLHRFAFQFGGLFTFLAIPISMYSIYQHLENNSKPHLQRHIVRILWMVPIYALDSWLALLLGVLCYMDKSIYFDTLRECYEAFTIYSFYCFTVAAMQDLKGISLERILMEKPPMKHWFPLRIRYGGDRAIELVRPWEMGAPFIRQVSWGILNYVVVKPLMTALTLVLYTWGKYDEGNFNIRESYLYIMLVNNFSQMYALYCLILLYEATHHELKPINPLAKFMCIKGVVFFTYWQQIMLATFAYFQVFTVNHRWECYTTMQDMIKGIQEVLICFEMLGFALLHAYAFPSRDFREEEPDQEGPRRSMRIRDIFDVSDVYEQVVSHVDSTVSGAGTSMSMGMKKGLKTLGTGVTATANTLFTSGGLYEDEESSHSVALLNPVSYRSSEDSVDESHQPPNAECYAHTSDTVDPTQPVSFSSSAWP